ncbi:methyltransferase, FkbM family [Pseudobacteriovorax antillogorgiicola]|uniref:Methyltransferase, FkbM family n=1 Tax=Pseudobacteriovorax antillogorgiicola TaxID=1513793 RepID=A0A1Y6CMY2_9BACT|nr:FkbM family methyltransferase [Pseudobacteriovorax antillogorgiicola]SMF75497.1 methyltransferase, FkbM family [Pseudobacteriovorax antillogorgiicola]
MIYGIKQALKNRVIQTSKAFFSKANSINSLIKENSESMTSVTTSHGKILLENQNSLTFWRYESFFDKEPETIAWIDTFNNGDILFDIGANIGLYSLYAGIKGVKVYAFEPESKNFALLNRNIYANKLDHLITAYNLAISDTKKLDYLYLSEFKTGAALHNFGENIDYNQRRFKQEFKQGILSLTLDELNDNLGLECPNHIKIDVDGLESLIISGSRSLLNNHNLKSLLIEFNLDLPDDRQTRQFLEESGFQEVPTSSKSGISPQVGNYIFRRRSDRSHYGRDGRSAKRK